MKYSLLLAILLPAPLAAIRAADAPKLARPNILVILADDLGYGDVGFNGCKDIPTPYLDRLAAQSMRCSNGYVTHSFCSPTRAALLTGRYQQRFGHENNPAWLPESTNAGLPLSQATMPQVLKQAGYKTGAIGKWHLADDVSESRDLAAEQPEVLKRLRRAYDDWNATNIKPLFENPRPNQPNQKKRAALKS